jgi:hypothetical protein
MFSAGMLVLFLCLFCQSLNIPLLDGDLLTAEERALIAQANKIDDRIKVYESASKRMQAALLTMVGSGDFSKTPETLDSWVSLLSGSLVDIEANLKAKKKSKALIRYEIQVRKSIGVCRNYKAKAPVEQQDAFDTCIARAEEVRKKFVDIIFKQ